MALGLVPILMALSAGDPVTCVPDTTGLTKPHTVFLGLAPGGLGSKPTPTDDDAIIAAAIRSHFQVPPRVTLPMWAWFVSAAISSVLRSRFNPAHMGGCAVPMLVQQTVSFTIGV